MVNAIQPQPDAIETIRRVTPQTVMGVDYSGAALAGKTAWVAELVPQTDPPFRLVSLQPLGRLAGTERRDAVNRYLVERICVQTETLWGFDFPFGLPVELPLGTWKDQLLRVRQFSGTAREFGLSLVQMTESVNGTKHVRRATDRETQTPFDCYHYRIIYQTFHGMRDILGAVAGERSVCVLPFQYRKAMRQAPAKILLEACPSSTLKRWGLPHRNYKQSGGRAPAEIHRRNRREILRWIDQYVSISSHRRRVIMNDPGGDALDAVLAGLGAWLGFESADHLAIVKNSRYRHEGYVYC